MRRLDPWPLLAVAVCLVLYWPGLTAWFHQDDFAWLDLGRQVRRGTPVADTLFAPMAQGTVRPLSERLPFVISYNLFGLRALPFRVAVFFTQFVNLFLLAWLARRLTGSHMAGAVAAVLWAVNAALATPMGWSSAYNQVLCAFFVLTGLRLLFQYLDTGHRRYYAFTWLALILGFGASEFMVVFPVAAALLVFASYRKLPRSVLALFVPSLAFALLQLFVLKHPAAGPYAMHWDARIFATLAAYWRWSLGPGQLEWFERMRAPLAGWLALALTLAILAFVAARARRREYLPLALLLWYPLWLAPVIALPDHMIEYYPALASIGLAMLGGCAAVWCWRAGKLYATWAVCSLALYATTSAIPARLGVQWHHGQGANAKRLVLGVASAEALYPGKTILLAGVDRELFWAGVFDNPFRLLGEAPVYLAPDTAEHWRSRPELGDLTSRFKKPVLDAVVYDARTGSVSVPALPTAVKETIQLGSEQAAARLGEGWYRAEGSHRWMAKRAVLTIPAGAVLRVEGYVPAFILSHGPIHLRVSAGGSLVGEDDLREPDKPFTAEFPLTAANGDLQITLEVDKTVRPAGDARDLGLAIVSVSVR